VFYCFAESDVSRMPWCVSRVVRLVDIHLHILPFGEFVLVDEKKNKTRAIGWLPCHHANIAYELNMKKNGDIVSILGMRMLRNKNRAPVSAAAKKIAAGTLGPPEYTKEQYLVRAEYAYQDQATWIISILYPYKRICNMNIRDVFQCLVRNPESICMRGSPACLPFLMYNEQKAWDSIQKMLRALSEPPYSDKQGFSDRMQWQRDTRYCTAALESPGENIHGLQFYQNMWTTQFEIDQTRTLRNAMVPANCRLWLGTPCLKALVGRKSVVNTLEEAFALKCFVSVDIYMVNPPFDERYRTEMGLPGIKTLAKGQDVAVPWAHRWGIDAWLTLIGTYPVSYMCVGRLDQYSSGRGQIFKQMKDASFQCEVGHHFKTNNVTMVDTDDVLAFVHSLKYPTIQCFSDSKTPLDIDTGRRWIRYPTRIRTLTQRALVKEPRVALCEEYFTLQFRVGENASVITPRYLITPVDVGVYICSETTKPFDIHAARTLCRHKLYVVNCQGSPFAWEHVTPTTIAISPFA